MVGSLVGRGEVEEGEGVRSWTFFLSVTFLSVTFSSVTFSSEQTTAEVTLLGV